MIDAKASVGLLLATALVMEFVVDLEYYTLQKKGEIIFFSFFFFFLFQLSQQCKNLSNRHDIIFFVMFWCKARFLDS